MGLDRFVRCGVCGTADLCGPLIPRLLLSGKSKAVMGPPEVGTEAGRFPSDLGPRLIGPLSQVDDR